MFHLDLVEGEGERVGVDDVGFLKEEELGIETVRSVRDHWVIR